MKKIRFIKDEYGVSWYSLHDVEEYLREIGAIDKNRNISWRIMKELSKKKYKLQSNLHSSIQIKMFDEFISWTAFSDFYLFCLKSEKDKIRKTNIIEAIDLRDAMDDYYPCISEKFQEVEFIQRIKQ